MARATHELRGPVGSVALMASALARQARQSSAMDLAASLERLSEQAERIQSMATRLLALSQLESGGLEVNLESVGVADAGRGRGGGHAARAWSAASPSRSRTLTCGVLADPLLLDEILANLLANARRYGGPNITVEVHARDGRVEFAVCDDGPGVPAGAWPSTCSSPCARSWPPPTTPASGWLWFARWPGPWVATRPTNPPASVARASW